MDERIATLTSELVAALAEIPAPERVAALNEVRARLHGVSPLRHHPVDLVLWIPLEEVRSNVWNPNVVAPPELKLLHHSVASNGYTMPSVGHRDEETIEIVDGFHRWRIGSETDIRASTLGHLPISLIRAERSDREARIAATIEHNRARGEHQVDQMSALVRMLYQAGWRDDKIQQELGMDADEVRRLKQITGLAELFADREYSEAWEPLQ